MAAHRKLDQRRADLYGDGFRKRVVSYSSGRLSADLTFNGELIFYSTLERTLIPLY
jgi:hypothetical protein